MTDRLSGVQKLITAFILFQGIGCGPGLRPNNVPESAVRIPGVKGADFWQHCWFEGGSGMTQCRVYNAGGVVLREGVFIPYLGESPKSQADLNILPKGGNEWIDLSDGTVLIPQREFGRVKHFLDWQRGLADRP